MKTKPSKLVIITFLIALFFLGYWVYDKWPRWEIREHLLIATPDDYSSADCITSIEDGCSTASFNWNYYPDTKGIVGEVVQKYCEYPMGYARCYIKEKVHTYR